MTEYDIVLQIESSQLSNDLPSSFQRQADNGQVRLIKSYKDDETDLHDAIKSFIDLVESSCQAAFEKETVMMIGVYYDTAFYTFRLNNKLLAYLGEKKIDLEVCAYPSED